MSYRTASDELHQIMAKKHTDLGDISTDNKEETMLRKCMYPEAQKPDYIYTRVQIFTNLKELQAKKILYIYIYII